MKNVQNDFLQWLIRNVSTGDLLAQLNPSSQLAGGEVFPQPDYNFQGEFENSIGQAANGHFSDKYKLPNHQTFSNESDLAQQFPELAGQWGQNLYLPSYKGMKKGKLPVFEGF